MNQAINQSHYGTPLRWPAPESQMANSQTQFQTFQTGLVNTQFGPSVAMGQASGQPPFQQGFANNQFVAQQSIPAQSQSQFRPALQPPISQAQFGGQLQQGMPQTSHFSSTTNQNQFNSSIQQINSSIQQPLSNSQSPFQPPANCQNFGPRFQAPNQSQFESNPVPGPAGPGPSNSMTNSVSQNPMFQKPANDFTNAIQKNSGVGPSKPKETLTYRDLRYFTAPPSGLVPLEDLLFPPARQFRPKNIVIILRGLPGSGKTHIAKLIKDKEVEHSKAAPRVLSMDDYFINEIEKVAKDESGRSTLVKEFLYEYEADMEDIYRAGMLKAFKKTVDDALYPFIIVDAVNDRVVHFEDFYNYAHQHRFSVYICDVDCSDPDICHKRNVHNRDYEEIKELARLWEKTPESLLQLDTRNFLQDYAIADVRSI